jgi:hypothetical protein
MLLTFFYIYYFCYVSRYSIYLNAKQNLCIFKYKMSYSLHLYKPRFTHNTPFISELVVVLGSWPIFTKDG